MQYEKGYKIDGRYELIQFVGSGSFGEVWVAYDIETDVEVAVKIYISMDAQGLSDFKKEFQLSFNFHHTNLLHANYLGVNAEDNRPYLVMPFCPEGSVMSRCGSMSEEQMWLFIRDVASGLAYLHGQNPPIIHQDIKPDNILIMTNGDYVITDFGISKQLRSSLRKSAMNLNSAGAVSYMGPERFSKQFQAVKASDMWSLGAAIYELATGDLPFCGMGGSFQKKGADIPELPDTYSDELNLVCRACLALETWDRPTASQLCEYASAFIRGERQTPDWLKIEPPVVAEPPKKVIETKTVKMESPADSPNGQGGAIDTGNQTIAEEIVPPDVKSEELSNFPVFIIPLCAVAGLILGVLLRVMI